ncbi:50S ribosomal protein L17 [bacterium]|nr:50S ribosomal protein L17 [bacterium]
MRKKIHIRKFSRKRDQRRALEKNLISQLYLHGKIKTTLARAKEIRKLSEKFLTRAKKADLSSRRILLAYFSKSLTKKLIDEIAPRYKNRNGGYTRIIKVPPRKSDGAKMAIIELVE